MFKLFNKKTHKKEFQHELEELTPIQMNEIKIDKSSIDGCLL